MFATVKTRFAEHVAKHLYRRRQVVEGRQGVFLNYGGRSYIDFCSNDYLGLCQHPKIIAALQLGGANYGVGSGASQLVSGHFLAHRELEQAFAEFLNRDNALLFSSGYLANSGVIATLAGRDRVILMDKLCHASLVDGASGSRAKLLRYRHLDMAHLNARIHQAGNQDKLIISESIFSMEGDLANLATLAKIATKHQALLMVDDAHGIGVLGQQGAGAVAHFGLNQQDVEVLVCPLGKAFACMGAIVAGSHELIENLLQFARSYMYSTALPPALAVCALASLRIIAKESWRREKLQELIHYFKKVAHLHNLPMGESNTAIQFLKVGASDKALAMSQYLLGKGYWVSAFRPPTVPLNTARLRITLSCLHSKTQLDTLVNELVVAHETLR